MTYTPIAATDVFLVGPHSVLERNGITFNDRTSNPDECYWVDTFTGFEAPDYLIGADPNVDEEGELAQPGFHGGRTMTMTGYVKAGSYTQFLNMGRALIDSLIDLVEMDLTISPASGSTIFTHQQMRIACRPADKPQLDMSLRASDLQGPIKRPFTVALRASRPSYRSVTTHHENLVPTSISQLGRVYDRTYDLVYETFLDPDGNPTVAGNSVVVHNDGNWRARPIIRFNGSMSGIYLINGTNGQIIRLKYPILAGDYVEIDIENQEITDSLGNSADSTWHPSSDWMWLNGKRGGATGDNTLNLLVDSFDASASIDIWWEDTSQ